MSNSKSSTATNSSSSASRPPPRPPLDTTKIGSNTNDFESATESLHSLHHLLNQQIDKATSQSLILKANDANQSKLFINFSTETQKLVDVCMEWQEAMRQQGTLLRMNEGLRQWAEEMEMFWTSCSTPPVL
ncbi:MAG: hypothetical protein L6R36_009217 [Xanthoria steineri]|nr:MAG: hypothetical protein L6R36_009217 [Xanthoria steineri]